MTQSIVEQIREQQRKLKKSRQASRRYAANRKAEIMKLKTKQYKQIINQEEKLLGVQNPNQILNALNQLLQHFQSQVQSSNNDGNNMNQQSNPDV